MVDADDLDVWEVEVFVVEALDDRFFDDLFELGGVHGVFGEWFLDTDFDLVVVAVA